MLIRDWGFWHFRPDLVVTFLQMPNTMIILDTKLGPDFVLHAYCFFIAGNRPVLKLPLRAKPYRIKSGRHMDLCKWIQRLHFPHSPSLPCPSVRLMNRWERNYSIMDASRLYSIRLWCKRHRMTLLSSSLRTLIHVMLCYLGESQTTGKSSTRSGEGKMDVLF